MEKLIRTIRPQVRAVGNNGRVQLIASTEACDSFNEVVCHDSYDLSLFKRNAPVPDSHNYDSIEALLGSVADARIDREERQLVCEIQLAIDVPENARARLAYGMIQKGHLRACSIGFYPVQTLTPMDGKPYENKLKELDLPAGTRPNRIYTRVKLLEVSLCILGANPEALVSAKRAGLINEHDLALIQKSAGSNAPFRTEPHTPGPDMNKNFLENFQRLIGEPKSATPERNGEPDNGNAPAPRALRFAMPTASLRTLCEQALDAQPEVRLELRAIHKGFSNAGPDFWTPAEVKAFRALTPGTSPGSSWVSATLAEMVLNLMTLYGAWPTLGDVPLKTGQAKVAKLTGEAAAYWITRGNAGAAITPDASIAGSSNDADCPTLAALVEVSRELVEDGKTTFEGALLEALVNALNKASDWACFMADGTDDTTDGAQTGIFQHGDVPIVNAAAGNTTIAQLEFNDFANVVAAVSANALQRPCRWWISHAFLPKLLPLKDGNEKLLKRGPDGEWMLIDFPVTWVAVAPSTDAAGQKIAAFGRGDSFMFAIAQQFEVTKSESGPSFLKNMTLVRALTRAHALMRKGQDFAILKTAAN